MTGFIITCSNGHKVDGGIVVPDEWKDNNIRMISNIATCSQCRERMIWSPGDKNVQEVILNDTSNTDNIA